MTMADLFLLKIRINLNKPIALRTAKTPWSFGYSECSRVKAQAGVLPEMGLCCS